MGYEIDFLPVGDNSQSGDAIALRFGDLSGKREAQTVVVVDGGFQKSGEELVKHIKKYYGTNRVDLVVSSHPDNDHISGLKVVLDKLDVKELWMHKPWEHDSDVKQYFQGESIALKAAPSLYVKSLKQAKGLEAIAEEKEICIKEPFKGLEDETGRLTVLGPSLRYYQSLLPSLREPRKSRPFDQAMWQERKASDLWQDETLKDEGETSASNNSSTILLLQVDDRNLLLTADAGIPALNRVIGRLDLNGIQTGDLNFIQVPHHGSRSNVGQTLLNQLIGPILLRDDDETLRMVAFLSAAENGGSEHPSIKVTNAFKRRGAPVIATQGRAIWHYHNAPERDEYTTATPLPFYDEVGEE